MGVSSGSAHAIEETRCGERSDFLEVWSHGKKLCFANTGTVPVEIYDVTSIQSGDNNIRYWFQFREDDQRIMHRDMEKWDGWAGDRRHHKVTKLTIW
ncbi:beta/gamma crystallin domain-containing protein [Streptomyces sp. 3N207]|uniref:beta/gamma crystallin domain-containing protein n=1 Tax=Streptomyces sp. 3N207 TaxID=3457417 RepID=UPI003FD3FE82